MLKFVSVLLSTVFVGILIFPTCPAVGQIVPATTIADAKHSNDGYPVSLSQKAVTFAEQDFFYIEEDGRNCGILVQMPGHTFSAGERVDIAGTMGTNDHQERMILATSAVSNGSSEIKPLILRCVSVGGGDSFTRGFIGQRGVTGSVGLNTIGLLVKVHGRYEQVDATTFFLDDGSGKSVKCVAPPGSVLHSDWQYVSVTGPCKIEDKGGGVYSPVVVVENLEALAPQPLLQLHVHCIRVSDDNGSRQASMTPGRMKQWVDFANITYAPAQINFLYDPVADFTDIQSTIINNMVGNTDPNWVQATGLANLYASAYPNKAVVFSRYGPGPDPTGGGFSWSDLNFVVMPGYGDASHCGHAHTEMLAHELGHYMGLWHTFPGNPFATKTDAENYFLGHGSNPAIFEGDGLSDTEPDPPIRTMECDHSPTVTLGTTTFTLPRTNIMSYYDEAAVVSPQQIDRVRWFLAQRMGNNMAVPTNSGVASPIEAETMQVVWTVNCSLSSQDMSPWGAGNWSAGNQLFGACSSASSFSLGLPVAVAGTYRLDMYATYAPDYGKLQVWVDGGKIGTPFDGYGPIVTPSGRVTLGNVYLTSGSHQLGFTMAGKNALSSGNLLGLDCFALVPVAP